VSGLRIAKPNALPVAEYDDAASIAPIDLNRLA
jgi:hypothetical protein